MLIRVFPKRNRHPVYSRQRHHWAIQCN